MARVVGRTDEPTCSRAAAITTQAKTEASVERGTVLRDVLAGPGRPTKGEPFILSSFLTLLLAPGPANTKRESAARARRNEIGLSLNVGERPCLLPSVTAGCGIRMRKGVTEKGKGRIRRTCTFEAEREPAQHPSIVLCSVAETVTGTDRPAAEIRPKKRYKWRMLGPFDGCVTVGCCAGPRVISE